MQALLLGAVLVFLGIAVPSKYVHAADFQQRSIFITSSIANADTTHTFQMGTVTPAIIGSYVFEYCINSPFIATACTPPPGLSLSSASLVNQSGITGFTIAGTSSVNRLVIGRSPSPTSPTPVSYTFDDVINPSSSNQTVYVRVTSHASNDGTGAIVDRGAVVFSTASGIGVGGYVPPYLTFCVGVIVNFGCIGGGQGFLEAFGELSSNAASTVTTQFGVATNDPTGYNVFMNGQTLTSGNQIITPLSESNQSTPGVSQFGVNLVSNNNPSVGANVAGPGVGAPTSSYNQQNRFRFVSGERIASAPLPAAFNAFTVSYLVNVPQDQAPGIYSSTITYTAIASF